MKTILIIEDDDISIKLTTEMLTLKGFKILQARNGVEGVNIAKASKPDLILMDIELPELNGIDAIKLLKSDPQTRMIKVIALTARAMVGDEELIRSAGADNYISKPYKYNDLLNAINQCS